MKERESKKFECLYCKNIFESKSNGIVMYCNKICRNNHSKSKKYENIFKDGIEGIDYVIDLWTGNPTPRIYGQYIKYTHPGKTIEDYKKEFPNAAIQCAKDLEATTKNSGLHMKKPEFKKWVSDRMKGELNINSKTKTTEEQRKARSPFSKDFYKAKGIDEIEIDELLNKFTLDVSANRISNTQLEYWINKCNGDLELANKLYKDRQNTFSLEKCIEKYGEINGQIMWKNRQEKWKLKVFNSTTHIGVGFSKISEELFNTIMTILNNTNYLYGKNEKFIKIKNTNTAFKYDFTDDNNKKIIEFNGIYWHCKPEFYESNYFHKIKNKFAKDIWEYDLLKINTANNYGYSVLVIWEDEYLKNKNKIVNKCIDFLNNTNDTKI